jgi:hypothetical protein
VIGGERRRGLDQNPARSWIDTCAEIRANIQPSPGLVTASADRRCGIR